MSSATGSSNRSQGTRGGGAVAVGRSGASARLRRLMEDPDNRPRGRGGNFTTAQMRQLATQAGMDPRRFRI